MKSKPIVMDHFSTIHTSYILNFKFTNNITILTGSSGTGKTDSNRQCGHSLISGLRNALY